jgi:two-component system, sensor histidine kinase
VEKNVTEPAIPASLLTPDVVYALEALIRVVERHSGRFRATVLMLSDDGTRLLDAAGSSMPAHYRQAVHGLMVGPAAGSCGTAAHRSERVIVEDIRTDPLWEDFRELAESAGVAACWSQPVRLADGTLMGTFALYYDEPKSPNDEELQTIEAAASRAALILERAREGASRDALVADLT